MIDSFLPMDTTENARHSYLTLSRLIDRLSARQVDVADLDMLKQARARIIARWPEVEAPKPARTLAETRVRNVIYNYQQASPGETVTKHEVVRLLRDCIGMGACEKP